MDQLKTKREALAKYSEFLSFRDRGFADSLTQFFDDKNYWTERQLFWVDTLTQKGRNAEPKQVQQDLPLPDGRPPIAEALARISQLFQKALDQGLKYPKIRLEAEDGTKVVLRYAGPTSNNPGSINITNHLPYNGGREFYGKINLSGLFVKSFRATPAILKLVNDLAKDPVGLAKLYGLKTSTCCFCSRPLNTSESVTMGYGPICAVKFGLPWGEDVESSYKCLTLEKEDAEANPPSP